MQAAAAGISIATLARWRVAKARADESGEPLLLAHAKSTGRPALAQPTADDVIKLKMAYIKSNRGKGVGSKTLAARWLAKKGELSPALTNAILYKGADPAQGPRTAKTPPKSVMDAMHVPPDVIKFHRAPKNQQLSGLYCPGTMRMVLDEENLRRLLPGERQSWDDGSINFCVCVPWPWGGDKCADKFGVKVGRFQMLLGIDDATDYAPGFSFVMRPLSSYRKEDVGAAMFRLWRDTYAPDSVVLEGGAWQSGAVLRFLDVAGVKWIDAKGRPHSKLVENYWGRLWSVLSQEDGQIGRFRGEMERENAFLARCQAGRADPRQMFPELVPALNAIETGLGYLNNERVTSKLYGSWIPQERFMEHTADHPRRTLEPEFGWLVSPEQHERIIRRGMVQVKASCAFGMSFPFHFAGEELTEFEGARARVHFDPYDSPVTATITLVSAVRGRAAGHVIARRIPLLDNAPQIMEMISGLGLVSDRRAPVGISRDGLDTSLKLRKAVLSAIRTEYRTLGFGGRRTSTEIRGADGSVLRADGGKGVPDGATAGTGPAAMSNTEYRRKEREATDYEELERFERSQRVLEVRQ